MDINKYRFFAKFAKQTQIRLGERDVDTVCTIDCEQHPT